MGEARRKLVLAARMVTFDFAAPGLVLSRADQEGLGGGQKAKAQATRILLGQLANAKYKDGMDRPVGKVWAAWQELMLEETEDGSPAQVVEIPMSQLDWLVKLAKDDAVKIRPELAQWREALVDYLEDLIARVEDQDAGGTQSA
jgi:hypothetical protein